MPYLVDTPDATNFLTMAGTETGAKALLGDPQKYDAGIGPEIANSSIILRTAVAKVAGLADDPTRTLVTRHEAASQLAAQVITQLTKAKTAIFERGVSLQEAGLTQADILFEPDSKRDGLDRDTRAFIKEAMKKPSGIAKVRALASEDRRFANVLHHSPYYLLGIEGSLHATMKYEVLEKHYPDTYQKISNGALLQHLAPKYDKVIHGVRAYFCNPTLAAQASRRVAV